MCKRYFSVLIVALSLHILLAPYSPAQQNDQRRYIVDIPGVNWAGQIREWNWGYFLNPDKITIYIRHQSDGPDNWIEPREADSIVVTLPNQWDPETADRLLQPIIEEAFASNRDVHYVVDTNITLADHLTPFFCKPEEDVWAGQVTDYLTKSSPAHYKGTLAEHSRGTLVTAHIAYLGRFSYIVIASPRANSSLDFLNRIPNSIPVDIIIGSWDAPSANLLLSTSLGGLWLTKKYSNVNILNLKNFHWPTVIHSRLQNLGFEGNWDIYTHAGSKAVRGRLFNLLQFPGGGGDQTSIIPPGETGGIDFSSIEIRFLTEFDNDLVGVAFRGTPSTKGSGISAEQVTELSWSSLFVFLALPNSTFWVNLNPAEPDRIVEAELGKTDVGRILLEADFQMKKDTALITHPQKSQLGRKFWDSLYEKFFEGNSASSRGEVEIPITFRVWIVPGPVTVWTTEDTIYIVDASMDVKLESEYLGNAADMAASADSTTKIQKYIEGLLNDLVLPELEKEVNNAHQYQELRQVFFSRIIAEWYKTKEEVENTALAKIIDTNNIEPWRSAEDWSARDIFNSYQESISKGEYSLVEESESVVGNLQIKTIRKYFSGGVDFTKIPMNKITLEQLLQRKPELRARISSALLSPTGHLGNEVWIGSIYTLGSSGSGGGSGDGDSDNGHGHNESDNGSHGHTSDGGDDSYIALISLIIAIALVLLFVWLLKARSQ